MKILAVMVRYITPLNDSPALQGLIKAFVGHPELTECYELLIWDNSPEAIGNPQLPIPSLYHHSPVNLGVSGAYNGAMQVAMARGSAWMLLLDQDTVVNAQFLQTMHRHAVSLDAEGEVAVIAPTVRVRNSIVSPRRQLFNRHRPYPPGEVGIAWGEAFAINSGSIMRIESLRAIGGFSLDFWLDYSDLYVSHQLHLHGKKIFRAADAELEHDMSIMDYDRLMRPSRYRNYSHAESAFNDLYKGNFENFVQNLRLFVRVLKQRRKYRNPEFSKIAWEQLIYRLRVPRRERIRRWFAQGAERAAMFKTVSNLSREVAP